MSKKRVFTGVNYQNKEKCKDCDNRDRCIESNKTLTAYSILLDCEGFYYVFCELEKILQRPVFDGNIEKYRKEIEEYEIKHENIPFLTPPLITNGALALELALKFLIFYEKKEFECGHDLSVLFSQLPTKYADDLKEQIYIKIHQDENSFNSNLKNISNIFVKYRYFFEYEAVGYTNFFTDIVHLVCKHVLMMKRELREEMDDNE